MTRTPLVAGNWKMNHTPTQAAAWCDALRAELAADELPEGIELGVAPAFPALPRVAAEIERGLPLTLIAQNAHRELSGAFTGEVSVPMLLDVGCRRVILGHSERRQLFGETDALIARKVRTAVDNHLPPILCIGETEQEREAGRTEVVLEQQLQRGLAEVAPEALDDLVVAYEPVWAIGTGRVATSDQVAAAHAFVRATYAAIAGADRAAGLRILYGGSVKPGNAAELAAIGDVDGFLVGGASLEAESFLAIARAMARTAPS
ncbi:MAG: triose-phosphate isomerase [Acidobacteria bacterium]|nr:MAG: triose-phosphate isomerase [Acidobacteriota bacterium]